MPQGEQASQLPYPVPAWGMPRWVNVLFAVIGAVMLGGLATVIAIPWVNEHRVERQFAATRIALPESFNGQSRRPVDRAEAALSAVGPGFTRTELGLYGESALKLVLILAARPATAMDDRDQALARAEFGRNFARTSNGAQATLTRIADPGRLGGWFGCGLVTGVTVCVATDSGSMVAVLMGPATPDPRELARLAREASVSRA
jgi:hypothetical protein